jgi:hypothetical protein
MTTCEKQEVGVVQQWEGEVTAVLSNPSHQPGAVTQLELHAWGDAAVPKSQQQPMGEVGAFTCVFSRGLHLGVACLLFCFLGLGTPAWMLCST